MTGATEEGVCSTQPRRVNRLKNGRHWFDEAVMEAEIKNFRWHDLRDTFASRLQMKGAQLEDIADLLGHKSLTHDKTVRSSRSEQAACGDVTAWNK
jgi:integrase